MIIVTVYIIAKDIFSVKNRKGKTPGSHHRKALGVEP